MPKNIYRPLLLLPLVGVLLMDMHIDKAALGQTPAPGARWSLMEQYIHGAVGGIRYELRELAPEFPQLSEFVREAKVTEFSLDYDKGRRQADGAPTEGDEEAGRAPHTGDSCRVSVKFRYPLAREEADALPAPWRVFRLKNGKLLASWKHVSAAPDERGKRFERAVVNLIRKAEAQLLDQLGADTRGSTKDFDAVPFDGTLEQGKLYRAEIAYDQKVWEWRTVAALKLPPHHAGRIKWLNVTKFEGLYFGRPPGARVEVVLEVVRREVERAAEERWNTTYECRILGVEGADPPPRADYLTLVGKCMGVRPTRNRSISYYFTFEVRRVVAGRYDAREFTIELSGSDSGLLLRALGVRDLKEKDAGCASSKEIEMTFELSDREPAAEQPGFLYEFRVIE